jgi:DNA polymerase elongation subunit (family B)
MLVGSEINDDKLIISHYNRDGRLSIIKKQINEDDLFNWQLSDIPTKFKTWNGKFITPVRTKNLSRFRVEELMFKYLRESDVNTIHEYNKPKIAYLDIENYVNQNNDFTDPNEALFPINVISVLVDTNVYVLTTLDELSSLDIEKMNNELNSHFGKFDKKFRILYKFFPSEKYLLDYFVTQLLPKTPFITGWNVINYDWLYITNRCQKLDIDITKKLVTKTVDYRSKIPTHIGMVDYIDAIKAFRPLSDLENHKLDTVADKVLGVKKLENPYNSFSEFIKDTYKFILYNIIDSVLISFIDDEIQMMDSSFAVGKLSEIEITKIFSSVYMSEIYFCREFYKRGICLPVLSKKRNSGIDFKYTGAFVKEPIPGFYEYVAAFDFNSMYPNIAIQFNMSPETYLGFWDKIDPKTLPSSFTKTIKGTVFDTTKRSVASTIFIDKYDQRKLIQKQKTELEKQLENIKI